MLPTQPRGTQTYMNVSSLLVCASIIVVFIGSSEFARPFRHKPLPPMNSLHKEHVKLMQHQTHANTLVNASDPRTYTSNILLRSINLHILSKWSHRWSCQSRTVKAANDTLHRAAERIVLSLHREMESWGDQFVKEFKCFENVSAIG